MKLRAKAMLHKTAATLLIASACLSCTACGGLDREYRLRFWEKCRISSEQALRKRRYKYAHAMAEEAVRQAEGFGDKDFRLGVSLCDLGDVEKAEGKTKAAEETYKRSIAVLDAAKQSATETESKGTSNPKIAEQNKISMRLSCEDLATGLAHLADLYAMEERYQDASLCFSKAAEDYQSIIGGDKWTVDDSPLGQELVQSLLGLAQVSMQLKNYDLAVQSYQRALDFAASSNCPEFLLREIRDAYLKLLQELGKQKEAQTLIADEMCLKLSQEGLSAYNGHDPQRAEVLFRQALQAAQISVFSERRMMRCMHNLVSALSAEGKFAEVEQVGASAAHYMQEHHLNFDRDFDEIISAHINLCKVYHREAQGLQPVNQQLQFRMWKYGPNSIQTCESIALKGQLELSCGMKKEAEESAQSAYRIIETKFANNRRAANAMDTTATLMAELQHADQAESILEKLCQSMFKSMDPNDPRRVGFQARLFIMYHKFGHREKALKLANEIAQTLAKGSADQRIAAMPYIVLMLSFSMATQWYDVAEPLAVCGQSILHKELQSSPLTGDNLANWNKDLAAMEKHFARKF